MNKIKSKKVHIAIVVMALLFLTGGYFAHSFMGANNDDATYQRQVQKQMQLKRQMPVSKKKRKKTKSMCLRMMILSKSR